MAVVIKDFEVVPPAGEGQSGAAPGARTESSAPDRARLADEIERLLQTHRERQERLNGC
jgi:hypothetical protein